MAALQVATTRPPESRRTLDQHSAHVRVHDAVEHFLLPVRLLDVAALAREDYRGSRVTYL